MKLGFINGATQLCPLSPPGQTQRLDASQLACSGNEFQMF